MSADSVPFLFTLDVHDQPKLYDKINVCLDVLGRQGVVGTFFVVANLVERRSIGNLLRRMVEEGHQVANHSLTHTEPEDVKEDPVELQVQYLREAKDILEQEIGREVTTFRAPAFKVSHKTLIALEETGHKCDSSVNSQRFPLFSSDLLNLGWYYAPRVPYHPSRTNCFRRGDLDIWEIPFTSFIFPFVSQLYSYFNMATARGFTRLMEWEARHVNEKPLVYMTHPEEFYPSTGRTERPKVDWTLLVPYRRKGFRLRLLFQQRDEIVLYRRSLEMNDFLKSREGLEFLTVDQYLERLH